MDSQKLFDAAWKEAWHNATSGAVSEMTEIRFCNPFGFLDPPLFGIF